MTYSIFTSCSLNYLPKARALAESVRKHHPDALLTLCLNDVAPDWFDPESELFDQVWFPFDLGYDRAWIFQHNVMELCTAVKGRALCRLLEENPAQLQIYLDPDVYLFNSLEPIDAMMEGASIGLVPHILEPERTDIGVEMTELSIAAHGVYNLGHLFVRDDSNGRSFAEWWAERLDKHCFDDRSKGLFTDQRWVDLAPALFEGVRILRTPVLDVATWNLAGRKIQQARSGDIQSFSVNGEPLITYHFSGTGVTGTHRKVREIFAPGNGASAEIERHYEGTIKRHGNDALSSCPCSFDVFDNGVKITPIARNLYRKHPDLRRAFGDPYRDDETTGSYQSWLREHHPNTTEGIHIDEKMLDQAYIDLFDEDFYLTKYPSVRLTIQNGQFASGLEHYEKVGSSLLMNPNKFFCSVSYFDEFQKTNRHAKANMGRSKKDTILWHYLCSGLAVGSEPNNFFDSVWYLKNNPDVREAFRQNKVSSPLAHFLKFGAAEKRSPGPDHSEHQVPELCKATRTETPSPNALTTIEEESDGLSTQAAEQL